MQQNFTLKTFAADVLAFADSLSIPKFSVLGTSGGCPYSLACAHFIPRTRLDAVMVLCGMSDLHDRPSAQEHQTKAGSWVAWLAHNMPIVIRGVSNLNWLIATKVDNMIVKMKNQLPVPDQKAIDANPVACLILQASTAESLRITTAGVLLDMQTFTGNWGFKVEDIAADLPVHFWYGEVDPNVPIGTGKDLVGRIKGAKGYYSEDGHLSIAIGKVEGVVRFLRDIVDGKEGVAP